MNFFFVFVLVLQYANCQITVNYNLSKVFEREGDVNVVFLQKVCNAENNPSLKITLINSAIWTVDRLNVLQSNFSFSIGLQMYDVCNEEDYFNTIFHLFQRRYKRFVMGIVTLESLPHNIKRFCDVLEINTKVRHKFSKPMIRATIHLLSTLNWKNNNTVVVQDQSIAEDVLKFAKQDFICIENLLNFTNLNITELSSDFSLILIADGSLLQTILAKSSLNRLKKVILVPLDGYALEDIPEGYYVIQPSYEISTENTTSPKVIPSTLLFDIAHPLVSYSIAVAVIIRDYCNNTKDITSCVRSKIFYNSQNDRLSIPYLLRYLQIDPLQSKFNYDIFRIRNFTTYTALNGIFSESYDKILSYNIFQDRNIDHENNFYAEENANLSQYCSNEIDCLSRCINFRLSQMSTSTIFIRSEAWVFAFLSISILGIISCVAIISFIAVRVTKKQILEGNPTLTILLLFTVIIMYSSVIAFAVDGDDTTKPTIILVRALSVAIPYAAAFSLLLSRVILLATISKEVGFLSHVAGSVQSFLCIFIFSVQFALSLQIIRRCENIFQDFFVIYLLSYNIILLALLLCLSPLIIKSQRNYKEGKYFVTATVLISCAWCCWVPSYVVFGKEWRDLSLCVGLVATASILVCTIFIPRTYMITISAARDRFTNALPSIVGATSAMDIYRASTQPVYDCVNIAAVNSINSRNLNMRNSQQDLYSSPTARDDEFPASNGSIVNPDKVTRF